MFNIDLQQHDFNSNAPFRIIIPREDVFIDIRDSYLEIETKIF